MKKILISIALLFLTINAHAGTVALNTITADSTVSTFNSNFSTIANAINGQIQGSATTGSSTNILADSIGELDMGDEINARIRDSELLGVGVDTTSVSSAFVYTGLTPPTSVSLTSITTAGTAYINGYRVAKGATSKTYTASKDTYVDLSQTGAYTYSEVTNGAAAPSVASNSARLAKVVTDGTTVVSVTDLANRRIPGLVIPTNFRSGLTLSHDTSTTIFVSPGSVEINGTMVSKVITTTMDISTAGNWAGGSSLRAVSTYGYVGIDASGNIKLHTTAPTHQNYALSVVAGKKRYASWSSTAYRALGWFYMDSSGSGNLNSYEVGNIKEGDSNNSVTQYGTTQSSTTSTSYADLLNTTFRYYSSGGPVEISFKDSHNGSGALPDCRWIVVIGTSTKDASEVGALSDNQAAGYLYTVNTNYQEILPQGTSTIKIQRRTPSGTLYSQKRSMVITEK